MLNPRPGVALVPPSPLPVSARITSQRLVSNVKYNGRLKRGTLTWIAGNIIRENNGSWVTLTAVRWEEDSGFETSWLLKKMVDLSEKVG